MSIYLLRIRSKKGKYRFKQYKTHIGMHRGYLKLKSRGIKALPIFGRKSK